MLAIFDNDGTICDSQEVDGICFARAIQQVTGRELSTLDWASYEEPTSSAIVREVLTGDPEASAKEAEIEREYVRLLQEERPRWPGDFCPLPGSVEFIRRLQEEEICTVAIATGCFYRTAEFKLRCCGIELRGLPHATSSDTPRRREIIPLAANRAGFDLRKVIYFGDGLWDAKVSHLLGIPMVGIGRRIDLLKGAGIEHTFQDYSDGEAMIHLLQTIREERAVGKVQANDS